MKKTNTNTFATGFVTSGSVFKMSVDNPKEKVKSMEEEVGSSHDEDDDFYEEINDPKVIKDIWTSIESLKKQKSTYALIELKLMLIEEWVHREDQNQVSYVDKKIFCSSFEKPENKKLLEFIGLRPLDEKFISWIIPATFSNKELDEKYKFITYIKNCIIDDDLSFNELLIYDLSLVTNVPRIKELTNTSTCKKCKVDFKSLMKHLNQKEQCKLEYSETDMADLDKHLKIIAKEEKKKLNSSNYQDKKDEIAQKYKSNSTEIKKKVTERLQNNREKINEGKLKTYHKNKEKYNKRKSEHYLENIKELEKRLGSNEVRNLPIQQRKKKIAELKKEFQTTSVMKENQNCVRKRKKIDFTMSDLEENNESDEEYKP